MAKDYYIKYSNKKIKIYFIQMIIILIIKMLAIMNLYYIIYLFRKIILKIIINLLVKKNS